jgi:serine/threonine protein kinase/WD40 repeat protein
MTASLEAEDDATEELIGRIAGEFTERLQRGEQPDVQQYTRQHPHVADILQQVLCALEIMRWPSSSPTSAPYCGAPQDGVPETLGEYRIIREVGRGGMGTVYEARQERLERRVALKVLSIHPLVDPQYLERFRREARAAAGLHHTNIVPVFGVGEHSGVHYYVMQFIRGHGLDRVLEEVRRLRELGTNATVTHDGTPSQHSHWEPIDGRPPDSRSVAAEYSCADLAERSDLSAISSNQQRYFHSVARIGVQVADALAYAHAQGVLHRDIKPSNLLLDDHGLIWVTDFGLAKTKSSTNLTQLGDVVGTLRYMAPERFNGRSDERTDIYSLGVTLYELVTLWPAFDERDRGRLIAEITHKEPDRPRKLNPQIPHDLETIVLKATAKDPVERYASAEELAKELRLFLADRPIEARRATPVERLWRWGRRNPLVAGLTASVAILLITIALGSSLMAFRLRTFLVRAEGAEAEAKSRLVLVERADAEKSRQLLESLLHQARFSRLSGQRGQRFDSLKAMEQAAKLIPVLRLGTKDSLQLRNEAIAAMTLADLKVVRSWTGMPAGSTSFVFSTDLARYARGDEQGTISVRRVDNDQQVLQLVNSGFAIRFMEFSPDDQFLAASYSRRGAVGDPTHVQVWDLKRKGSMFQVPIGVHFGWPVGFQPGASQVVIGHLDGSIRSHDLATGRELKQFSAQGSVDYLCVAPDGEQLAACGVGSRDVRILQMATGKTLRKFVHAGANEVRALAWHPGSRRLAAASGKRIYLWDVQATTDKPLAILDGQQSKVTRLAFSQDGSVLSSQGFDSTLRLWDVATRRQLVSMAGGWPQFSLDDRQLAYAHGSQLGLLQLAKGEECRLLGQAGSQGTLNAIDLGSNGRLVASAHSNGIRLWDAAAAAEVAFLPMPNALGIVFDRVTGDLITSGASGLKRWPVIPNGEGSAGSLRVGPPRSLRLPAGSKPEHVALSQDGRTLVSKIAHDQAIVLHEGQTRPIALKSHPGLWSVAISPDGLWIATGPWNAAGICIWESRSGKLIRRLPGMDGTLRARLAFSADGQWLVTSTSRAEIRFWQVGTWEPHLRIARDYSGDLPSAIALNRESSMLAIEHSPNRVRLVGVPSGAELATLDTPGVNMPSCMCFSDDGSLLVIGDEKQQLHIWDLGRIRAQLATMNLDWEPPAHPPAPQMVPPKPWAIRLESQPGEPPAQAK